MVDIESLFYYILLFIVALHQIFASDVKLGGYLGRIELDMISAA